MSNRSNRDSAAQSELMKKLSRDPRFKIVKASGKGFVIGTGVAPKTESTPEEEPTTREVPPRGDRPGRDD